MNKMIIFLCLLFLNSYCLCLTYFRAVANLQRRRKKYIIVLAHPHYLHPSYLPILTPRKPGFSPACRSIWEIFTLHIKNKCMYMYTGQTVLCSFSPVSESHIYAGKIWENILNFSVLC